MKFVNQHSFILLAGVVLLSAMLGLLRGGLTVSRLLMVAGLAIILAVVYILFNPAASSSSEALEFKPGIGNGRPVFLEFQSQY